MVTVAFSVEFVVAFPTDLRRRPVIVLLSVAFTELFARVGATVVIGATVVGAAVVGATVVPALVVTWIVVG